MARLQRRHSCVALGSGPPASESTGVFSQAAQSLLSQPQRPSSRGSFTGSDVASPAAARPRLARRGSAIGGIGLGVMGLSTASTGEGIEGATKSLTEAIASMDSGKLLGAIGIAKGLGVDQSLVQEAQKQLQRLEMKSSLLRAIREERLADLEIAVIRAEKLHLDTSDIEKAKALLKFLQAEERLNAAIGMRDFNAIQWALEHAATGVRETKLQEANTVLDQIDLQSKLKSALKFKKPNDIRKALKDAVDGGVTGPVVEEAQRLTEQQTKEAREKAEAARKGASANPVEKEAAMLAEAVKMKDASALKMALNVAKDAGVSKSDRRAAQELLSQLEAVKALEVALKGKDMKKLQGALAAAETAGVRGTKEVEAAQKLIAQMDSASRLEKAVKSRSLEDLDEALEEARSCGIAGMSIDKAERIKAQLEAAPKAPTETGRRMSSSSGSSGNLGRRGSVSKASKSSASLENSTS